MVKKTQRKHLNYFVTGPLTYPTKLKSFFRIVLSLTYLSSVCFAKMAAPEIKPREFNDLPQIEIQTAYKELVALADKSKTFEEWIQRLELPDKKKKTLISFLQKKGMASVELPRLRAVGNRIQEFASTDLKYQNPLGELLVYNQMPFLARINSQLISIPVGVKYSLEEFYKIVMGESTRKESLLWQLFQPQIAHAEEKKKKSKLWLFGFLTFEVVSFGWAGYTIWNFSSEEKKVQAQIDKDRESLIKPGSAYHRILENSSLPGTGTNNDPAKTKFGFDQPPSAFCDSTDPKSQKKSPWNPTAYFHIPTAQEQLATGLLTKLQFNKPDPTNPKDPVNLTLEVTVTPATPPANPAIDSILFIDRAQQSDCIIFNKKTNFNSSCADRAFGTKAITTLKQLVETFSLNEYLEVGKSRAGCNMISMDGNPETFGGALKKVDQAPPSSLKSSSQKSDSKAK